MPRLIIYDRTDTGLSPLWAIGAGLAGGPSAGVTDWSEFGQAIDVLRPSRIDYWGHGGSSTGPLCGGERMPSAPEYLRRLVAGKGVRTVWWRVCSAFGGPRGQWFAELHSDNGLRGVGHTKVISAPLFWRQRAVCGIRPGERAWWSESGDELRGCSTFRNSIPPFAWFDNQ